MYELVSGTVMLALVLSRGPATGSMLLVVGGVLLNYVMGGLTFALWLVARRSRVQRLPLVSDVDPSIEEKPTGLAVRNLRIGLAICAALFSIATLALLVVVFSASRPQSAVFMVAAGNAVAVYAGLAFLSSLSAESPRRHFYAHDIMMIVSLFATIALLFWTIKYELTLTVRILFLIGAIAHLIIPVVTVILHMAAARRERPTLFFGVWLHRVFEQFAEVILKGDIEVITPREIADAADALLAEVTSPRIAGVKIALATIEMGALLRFRVPMSRMGRLEREQYLVSGLFRDLIRIKQLVFFMYYSDERTYEGIGFVQFKDRELFKRAEQENKFPSGPVVYPAPVDDRVLETEVCVIGSGAGGAVLATRLAEAGKRVIILEEGPFLKRDRVNHDERSMQTKSYREGGLQLTLDFDMYILQGRCVGGSTFVNNGVCFDLPEPVFREWVDLGAGLDKNRLDQAFDRVRSEIQIIRLEEHQHLLEKSSSRFVEGAHQLGLTPDWFEVNLDGCIGCGYCTIGCPYEKKMSVDLSYIPRALEAGAILVSDCTATTITTTGSKAQTVRCQRADGTPLEVQARQIVVAGGAIGSSLLLLSSGIKRNVGTRLSFNAGSWVFAEFPDPVDSFDGIQMCAYADRPRYFMETIAMSPGAFAAAMPGWFQDHFDRMRRYRYFAVAGALVGTQPVGRVIHSSLPLLADLISPSSFELPISDLRKLREGVKHVCQLFFKAGAMRVIPATFRPLEFTFPSQLYRLDEFVVEPDDISFGSAHPQGGNPMSDNQDVGAVDTHFRVHGFDNLFVCDASIFPASIQVNPQLTVMALADYASSLIADM
jgi:choline dehydrogenase-like flavoprotein